MEVRGGIRLRLEPQDEYMHPIEEAENFNESMYFNIFDARGAPFGGWFRIGNRPNEGYAETTCCIYLPDGKVGFMFSRPEISNNDVFDAGGMKFKVVEPFGRLKVNYDGKVCLLKNPLDMANPKKAFQENPVVGCHVDIDYYGISPVQGGEPVNEDGSPIVQKADEDMARGHYEQHVGGKGVIRVGDGEYELDGYGLRDHSWGPRYWQSIDWYRWFPMNFGNDFGMMITIITKGRAEQDMGAPLEFKESGRQYRVAGMVLHDSEYVAIEDAEVHTVWDPYDYPKEVKIWAKTAEREYNIEGKVLSLIPLRNRRKTLDGAWLNTRITEGMMEYRCDDRVGYGMSEYLDQIVEGKTAGREDNQ